MAVAEAAKSAAQNELSSLDERINALKATLKSIGDFDITSGVKAPSDEKSSRNEAYQEALKEFEYKKKLNDMELRSQLEYLQRLNAQYKKSLDEQRDMDLRLKDARDGIREEELSLDRAYFEHRKAMGADVFAEEIARNKAAATDAAKPLRERWAAEERIYELERDALAQSISDRQDAFNHLKAIGENTLAAEIAWNESIFQNEIYTAEQREKAQENLHRLKRQVVDESMAADERRLAIQRINGDESLQIEIDMLDNWLRYYELTDEQIISIMKRRYQLQRQLTEAQEKEADAAFKRSQDAQIGWLNSLKNAWKDWEDSVSKSIRGYLGALDEMEKRESRAEREAEERRKIEAAKLKLAYENDAYNREKLQKNLDDLNAERQKRLAKEAREDAKTALNDALSAAKEMSDERRRAIDAEAARIKELTAGDSLFSSLVSGGESSLMRQVSQSVDSTLNAYKTEFSDVGKTLGQSIEEGLSSALDRVLQTFEQFRKNQTELNRNLAGAATSAAIGYEQRNTTQVFSPTINFYQPVPTPYEVAREIEDVGRRLMYG